MEEKEIKLFKVKYNQETTKVEGYLPSFMNYPNNVIDEEAKTIDGSPYIEITEEEHKAVLGKQMAVVDGVLVEYTKTDDELIAELKNSKLAACIYYLNNTDWQAIRKADSGEAMKDGVAENRALARSLQTDINEASTMEELQAINTDFA
jgi:hypothetical protein